MALILLAGFLELLLPEDGMRRYSRMVIGLLVLLSLVQLLTRAGGEFAPELWPPGAGGLLPSASTSALLKEGERIRKAGEEKAAEDMTRLLEERITRILKAFSGGDRLRVRILESEGKISGAKIFCDSQLTYPPDSLKRLVGELLRIDSEAVEVEKAFEERRE